MLSNVIAGSFVASCHGVYNGEQMKRRRIIKTSLDRFLLTRRNCAWRQVLLAILLRRTDERMANGFDALNMQTHTHAKWATATWWVGASHSHRTINVHYYGDARRSHSQHPVKCGEGGPPTYMKLYASMRAHTHIQITNSHDDALLIRRMVLTTKIIRKLSLGNDWSLCSNKQHLTHLGSLVDSYAFD